MPPVPEAVSAENSCQAIRVLGLDPAAAGPTGYGVIDSDGRKHRLVHYGALKVPAQRQKESAGATLLDIHSLVCRLVREFSPHVMAVEGIFTALNMRTALRLAEVRGVVLLAAEQHGLAVHSYSPREIKASVAGYGHADKRQMQVMVRALLALSELPEPLDAADALAVALCHLQAEHSRRLFTTARSPERLAVTRVPPARNSAAGATRSRSSRILPLR